MRLPKRPKRPSANFAEFTGLIYGREKIGKTTLLSTFPDTLFLSTEPGTKGLSVYEIPISSWKEYLDAVALLEADDKRFQTVAIDTIDLLYDYCKDYTKKKLGIEHMGETSDGRGDFGKSWSALEKEFRSGINRVANSHRGLWLTSHYKVDSWKRTGDTSLDRIMPSMKDQAKRVILSLVDFIWYIEHHRMGGKPVRVIYCEGDDGLTAGSRVTESGRFPALVELKEKGGYKELLKAFEGKLKGLDPSMIDGSAETSATAEKTISRMKRKDKKK